MFVPVHHARLDKREVVANGTAKNSWAVINNGSDYDQVQLNCSTGQSCRMSLGAAVWDLRR